MNPLQISCAQRGQSIISDNSARSAQRGQSIISDNSARSAQRGQSIISDNSARNSAEGVGHSEGFGGQWVGSLGQHVDLLGRRWLVAKERLLLANVSAQRGQSIISDNSARSAQRGQSIISDNSARNSARSGVSRSFLTIPLAVRSGVSRSFSDNSARNSAEGVGHSEGFGGQWVGSLGQHEYFLGRRWLVAKERPLLANVRMKGLPHLCWS